MEDTDELSDVDWDRINTEMTNIRYAVMTFRRHLSMSGDVFVATQFVASIKRLATLIYGEGILGAPQFTLKIPIISDCDVRDYTYCRRPDNIGQLRIEMFKILFSVNVMPNYTVEPLYTGADVVYHITSPYFKNTIRLEKTGADTAAQCAIVTKIDATCNSRVQISTHYTTGDYKVEYRGTSHIRVFTFGPNKYIIEVSGNKHSLLAGSTPHFCPENMKWQPL